MDEPEELEERGRLITSGMGRLQTSINRSTKCDRLMGFTKQSWGWKQTQQFFIERASGVQDGFTISERWMIGR
jgi:hypothetical protein